MSEHSAVAELAQLSIEAWRRRGMTGAVLALVASGVRAADINKHYDDLTATLQQAYPRAA